MLKDRAAFFTGILDAILWLIPGEGARIQKTSARIGFEAQAGILRIPAAPEFRGGISERIGCSGHGLPFCYGIIFDSPRHTSPGGQHRLSIRCFSNPLDNGSKGSK